MQDCTSSDVRFPVNISKLCYYKQRRFGGLYSQQLLLLLKTQLNELWVNHLLEAFVFKLNSIGSIVKWWVYYERPEK